jgi:flagellar biosynthesis/type III secretory pathway protein FliH
MARKVIDRNSFAWRDDNRSRLNYHMIFDENWKDPEEQAEEEKKIQPNIEEILAKRRIEEERRLAATEQKAFEDGLRQGRQEGLNTAKVEMNSKIAVIERALREAHQAWIRNQELLKPGMLHLIFDVAEAVIGVPNRSAELKKHLENEIVPLLEALDKAAQPVLWVSEDDFQFVDHLVEQYAAKSGIMLRVGNNCKPGEYQLESNRQKVVRDFKMLLDDFRESLILPQFDI